VEVKFRKKRLDRRGG